MSFNVLTFLREVNASPASHGARCLAFAIAQFADTNGIAFPSVVTLSEMIRSTDRSTRRWQSELIDLGIIDKNGRHFRCVTGHTWPENRTVVSGKPANRTAVSGLDENRTVVSGLDMVDDPNPDTGVRVSGQLCQGTRTLVSPITNQLTTQLTTPTTSVVGSARDADEDLVRRLEQMQEAIAELNAKLAESTETRPQEPSATTVATEPEKPVSVEITQRETVSVTGPEPIDVWVVNECARWGYSISPQHGQLVAAECMRAGYVDLEELRTYVTNRCAELSAGGRSQAILMRALTNDAHEFRKREQATKAKPAEKQKRVAYVEKKDEYDPATEQPTIYAYDTEDEFAASIAPWRAVCDARGVKCRGLLWHHNEKQILETRGIEL